MFFDYPTSNLVYMLDLFAQLIQGMINMLIRECFWVSPENHSNSRKVFKQLWIWTDLLTTA